MWNILLPYHPVNMGTWQHLLYLAHNPWAANVQNNYCKELTFYTVYGIISLETPWQKWTKAPNRPLNNISPNQNKCIEMDSAQNTISSQGPRERLKLTKSSWYIENQTPNTPKPAPKTFIQYWPPFFTAESLRTVAIPEN